MSIAPSLAIASSRQIGNARLQRALLRIIKEAHAGKAQATTLEDLRSQYFPELGDSRAIRQAINEMRKDGIPIGSLGGVGTYWPADIKEAMECVAELRAKGYDLLDTAASMEKGAIAHFGEQQVLGI